MHCKNSPLEKITVFRNMTPCGLVDMRQNLRGLLPRVLVEATVGLSEMWVRVYQTTRRYIPGNWSYRCENGGRCSTEDLFSLRRDCVRITKGYNVCSEFISVLCWHSEWDILHFCTKFFCFRLVTDVPLWRPRFSPRPVSVGFVVDRLALGQVFFFFQVLQFSHISIILPILLHLSLAHCGRRNEWQPPVTCCKKFLCFTKFW
jgi:hypothetical protein